MSCRSPCLPASNRFTRCSANGGPAFWITKTKVRIRAQAERVGWRQLLRWVQAQLAMIEVGMAQRAEVFMPYIQQADGRTFFEYFEAKQLALPPGEGIQ